MVLTTSISEDQTGGFDNSIQGYEKDYTGKHLDKGINLYKVNEMTVGLQPLGIFSIANNYAYNNVRIGAKKICEADPTAEVCLCDKTKTKGRLNSEEMYYTFGRYCNQSGYNQSPGLAVRGAGWIDVSNVSTPKETKGALILSTDVNIAAASFNGGYQSVPINHGDNLDPSLQPIQRSRDKLITKLTQYNGCLTFDPSGNYPRRRIY